MDKSEAGGAMTFDVAIVSYNTDFYLFNLLVSLQAAVPAERLGHVHVWDNGSSDETVALLAAFAAGAPWLRAYVSSVNIHHGPALDRLLREYCAAEWVLLLDPDTEVRRDFVPSLPRLAAPVPAFVGQMHPQMPHLYAYLAHVLVHRPTYFSLPAFRHDGAPGDEFFRMVETRQLPYARFRWCDFVTHAGQGALRGVYARGETTNAFHDFAAREVQASPTTADRQAREERLRTRLAAFLARPAEHRSGHLPPAPLERASLAVARLVVPDIITAAFDRRCIPADGVAPRSNRSNILGRRALSAGRLAGLGAGRNYARDHSARLRSSSNRLRTFVKTIADPPAARVIRRARRIGLVQQPQEIRGLLKLVRRLRPRRVLEIGTAYGGSLYLWAQIADPDAHILSVDLPPWEHDDPWEANKVAQFRSFARARQRVDLIRADSHDSATLDAVRAALGGDPLDFLFIDGDHSYEGARRDVADYGSFLRPGGIIALHGIQPHSKGWRGDVTRLWRELAASHPSAELIADRLQDGFGIGVLWT